jgi:hypothetical protein
MLLIVTYLVYCWHHYFVDQNFVSAARVEQYKHLASRD